MRTRVNMLRLEWKIILRDKVMLYMILAPALLGFLFINIAGGISESIQPFVMIQGTLENVAHDFEKVGQVEWVKDEKALRRRVQSSDYAVGIMQKDTEVYSVFEGNEGEAFRRQTNHLISQVLSGKVITAHTDMISSTQDQLIKPVMLIILMTALFMAGAVPGLSTVLDQENKVLKSYEVTPLGLKGYGQSKLIIALCISIINLILCGIIFRRIELIGSLMLIGLSSLGLYKMIIKILGRFADNQVGAIGVMKLIMPVFMVLPLSAYFVPEQYIFLYYPLPMYWQYESLLRAIEGKQIIGSLAILLVLSILWLQIMQKVIALKKA